ncbi:MAG TPA: radical SAM protein [Leptospiraceae bacterium]|nr:radical SAM protein [Leptospiraceae bacterium]HNN76644.1 radical SAM protein [Leptospiraceae bacterium]
MLILDFYVDEPACFGVPPYLSPYARYAAGALVSAGIPQEKIEYLTVDDWRAQGKELKNDPELVILIGGATVPGKYLGGKIGTVTEMQEFLEFRKKRQKGGVTLMGGPVRFASRDIRESFEDLGGTLIRGDVEVYAERIARDPRSMREAADSFTHTGERWNYEMVNRWAPAGAFLINLHPNFPWLILELETYRGCTRDVFCSFCTEALYGKPVFRALPPIVEEVSELYKMGARHFRIGRQADLMTYLPDMNDFKNSFPRPVPASLEALYSGIRNAAPDLKMLHLDNINPGLIATFEKESREIAHIICKYNTAGDTAAMGMESADIAVIEKNDLKSTEQETYRAIEIINEAGARREGGVPKLLPGINLLHGLPGESEDTFKKNYEFLKRVIDNGLLLRRINIRQTVTYEHTKLDQILKERTARKKDGIQNRFMYYRDRIRREIDHPMLLLNFPPGTILRDVILESQNQGWYFGRPLGSYPVTVKIPLDDRAMNAKPGTPCDVIITGAEERSLTALSYPVHLSLLGRKALETIPGAGRQRALRLQSERPLNFQDFSAIFEGRPFGKESDYVFGVTGSEMSSSRPS